MCITKKQLKNKANMNNFRLVSESYASAFHRSLPLIAAAVSTCLAEPTEKQQAALT